MALTETHSWIGNIYLAGTFGCETLNIPSDTITNAHVNSSAAIAATKLKHQYVPTYSQEAATKSASGTYTIHIVHGATATIDAFEAAASTVCGSDGTVTVDLRKNGVTTSLLSAAIQLDTNNTAYIVETATISTASLTNGDVLQVVITSSDGTAGTAASGVMCAATLVEDP